MDGAVIREQLLQFFDEINVMKWVIEDITEVKTVFSGPFTGPPRPVLVRGCPTARVTTSRQLTQEERRKLQIMMSAQLLFVPE